MGSMWLCTVNSHVVFLSFASFTRSPLSLPVIYRGLKNPNLDTSSISIYLYVSSYKIIYFYSYSNIDVYKFGFSGPLYITGTLGRGR